jgi:hypothetical protein
MNKIIEAGDILAIARDYIECVSMAAGSIQIREQRNPIISVADMASKKIDEALALLDEYRDDADESEQPGASK